MTVQERRQSRLSLRRFKTVLKGGRKEPSHPYGQPISPDKRTSNTNLSKFTPFGKKTREMPIPTTLSPQPTGTLQRLESQHSGSAPVSEAPPAIGLDALPSSSPPADSAVRDLSELVNGTNGETPKAEEPLQTVPESSAPEVRNSARLVPGLWLQASPTEERPAPVLQGSSAIDQALAEAAL
jgi:hypothetical protein